MTCLIGPPTSAAESQGARSVVDDTGERISLAQPAQRLISLAPSLTELIYAAGAGDKLVGVVEYSDYPEAATRVPLIGRFDRFDIERILALRPDVIFAWQSGNPPSTIDALRRLGLTVYLAEPRYLESIPQQLQKIGQLAGTEITAARAVDDYNAQLTALRARYSNAEPVRVFYQVWDRPLMTAGGAELSNDLIALCGGVNIFGELSALAPKVNLEAVLKRDPEIIVASGQNEERPPWLDAWDQWTSLSAVRLGQVTFIDPDLTQRHSPRVLIGAETLCESLDETRRLRAQLD